MSRPAFEIGGREVAPGTTAEIRLEVAESYVAEAIRVPVTVAHGREAGPTLFLTAAVHGDELNGVGILRDLLSDPRLRALAGTLIAVPVVNVPGFLAVTRDLPDHRDLNRSFPGNPRGSLTHRLAHVLFREVVERCDHGIDLHTGAAERTNYPQVRADLEEPRVAEMARAFGVPLLLGGKGPAGCLRRSATERGVPTIVYEAGAARRLEQPMVDAGITGVLRVMSHLGMLPGEAVPEPGGAGLVVERTRWLRARAGGILDVRVRLGQPLAEGELVAVNHNPFGRERSQLRAPFGGVVVGLNRLPLVHPGDAVCHLGKLPADLLAGWRREWESGG